MTILCACIIFARRILAVCCIYHGRFFLKKGENQVKGWSLMKMPHCFFFLLTTSSCKHCGIWSILQCIPPAIISAHMRSCITVNFEPCCSSIVSMSLSVKVLLLLFFPLEAAFKSTFVITFRRLSCRIHIWCCWWALNGVSNTLFPLARLEDCTRLDAIAIDPALVTLI